MCHVSDSQVGSASQVSHTCCIRPLKLNHPDLPFAASPAVVYFRHALALDERRARFVPEYARTDKEIVKLQETFDKEFGQHLRSRLEEEMKKLLGQRDRADKQNLKRSSSAPAQLNSESSATAKKKTRLSGPLPVRRLEVWFRGAHSDVGGGVESRVPRASFRYGCSPSTSDRRHDSWRTAGRRAHFMLKGLSWEVA
jgi:hypothetical protein